MHEVLESGRVIGAAPYQLGAAFLTYGVGRITGRSRVTSVGAELVRAQPVSQGLTFGIKVSAGRTRPDGTGWSFPSGHASTTFASAAVLQRNFGRRVGAGVWCRDISFGVPRPTESPLFQRRGVWRRSELWWDELSPSVMVGASLLVTPTAAPGGAGVAFAWVRQP